MFLRFLRCVRALDAARDPNGHADAGRCPRVRSATQTAQTALPGLGESLVARHVAFTDRVPLVRSYSRGWFAFALTWVQFCFRLHDCHLRFRFDCSARHHEPTTAALISTLLSSSPAATHWPDVATHSSLEERAAWELQEDPQKRGNT
jgi:hypothetical protein